MDFGSRPIQKYTQYDPTGQLVKAIDQAGDQVTSFEYDANGNRIGRRDAYDRLRDDAAHRFDYDAEGNVIRRFSLQYHLADEMADENWELNPVTETKTSSDTMVNESVRDSLPFKAGIAFDSTR